MFALFPLVVSMLYLVRGRFQKPALSFVVVFLLAYTATLTPWLVRNHSELGEFPVLATNGGEPFWFGNNLDAKGSLPTPPTPAQGLELRRLVGDGGEVAANSRFYAAGLDYLYANPVRALKVNFNKLMFLWNVEMGDVDLLRGVRYFPYLGDGWRKAASWALSFPFPLLSVAFLFALFFVEPVRDAEFLLAFVVYTAVVAFVFVGATRYHLAFVPHLIICTAGAARLRKGGIQQRARVLGFSATLAVYLVVMAYFNFSRAAYLAF